MAYTAQMAAALSGATRRQLSHWRRDTGSGVLLVPEISAEPPRVLYSFRDLLALRSCVYLRQNVSLQKIREAISNLRDLGEREHLSRYTLVSDSDTIVLAEGEDATDLSPWLSIDMVEDVSWDAAGKLGAWTPGSMSAK